MSARGRNQEATAAGRSSANCGVITIRIMATVLLAVFMAAPTVSFAQKAMTPQQYHKEKGPCACPGDKDNAGRLCGKRSAFCRSGEAEVQCFRAGDVEKRKKEACR